MRASSPQVVPLQRQLLAVRPVLAPAVAPLWHPNHTEPRGLVGPPIHAAWLQSRAAPSSLQVSPLRGAIAGNLWRVQAWAGVVLTVLPQQVRGHGPHALDVHLPAALPAKLAAQVAHQRVRVGADVHAAG